MFRCATASGQKRAARDDERAGSLCGQRRELVRRSRRRRELRPWSFVVGGPGPASCAFTDLHIQVIPSPTHRRSARSVFDGWYFFGIYWIYIGLLYIFVWYFILINKIEWLLTRR
jgi:hypothetical protein